MVSGEESSASLLSNRASLGHWLVQNGLHTLHCQCRHQLCFCVQPVSSKKRRAQVHWCTSHFQGKIILKSGYSDTKIYRTLLRFATTMRFRAAFSMNSFPHSGGAAGYLAEEVCSLDLFIQHLSVAAPSCSITSLQYLKQSHCLKKHRHRHNCGKHTAVPVTT